MTVQEINILVSLDQEVEQRPESLSDVSIRLYRSLLSKYISEMSLVTMGKVRPPAASVSPFAVP